MNKDWKGNTKTTFATLGASNHSREERHTQDYYATSPHCAIDLLNILPELDQIWECACGEGHLAEEFDKANKLAPISQEIMKNTTKLEGVTLKAPPEIAKNWRHGH